MKKINVKYLVIAIGLILWGASFFFVDLDAYNLNKANYIDPARIIGPAPDYKAQLTLNIAGMVSSILVFICGVALLIVVLTERNKD